MPRPLMALFIEFLLALPCPLCYPVYKHKFHKESSVPGIHAVSFYSGQLPSPQRAGSVFLSELYASSNYLQQAGRRRKRGWSDAGSTVFCDMSCCWTDADSLDFLPPQKKRC